MNCPVCKDEALNPVMAKNGVIIDICSKCGGIWLDKGEIFYFTKQPGYLAGKIKESLIFLPWFEPESGSGPKSYRAHHPGNDSWPTHRWQPHTVIEDRYLFRPFRTTTPGKHQIYISVVKDETKIRELKPSAFLDGLKIPLGEIEVTARN